jgi:hypothetical protein
METAVDSGWSWSELDDIGPESPKGARAQRDALKLLAAFIQHSDNKPSNQRILCPEGQEVGKTGCRAPVLMIHDLGITFGAAALMNQNKNGASFVNWSEVPVWKDPATCVAQLETRPFPGKLRDPQISEAGRAFLAGLLVQLTDTQLRDLFEVARVTRRSTDPSDNPDAPPATVDEWVNVFKLKRTQIVATIARSELKTRSHARQIYFATRTITAANSSVLCSSVKTPSRPPTFFRQVRGVCASTPGCFTRSLNPVWRRHLHSTGRMPSWVCRRGAASCSQPLASVMPV